MAKIVFVNRYFFPDHSATSQLLSDLAFDLAGRGQNIHVVTGGQLYDEPLATLPSEEKVRGVHVHRVAASRFGRSGLWGRILDYVTFYIGAAWHLAKVARPGDIVVAKTDPPLLSIVAAFVTRLRRAHLVNWIQDLFPEIAESLEVHGIRLASPLLRALRNQSLRWAVYNVALGNIMKTQLVNLGIRSESVRIIHNWADGEQIIPLNPCENNLRHEWNLQDKLVVGYSGNMGLVHEFETVLRAAEALRLIPDIAFLFIGDGAQRDWLMLEARRRRLPNILFRPYQPREMLRCSLSLPDVHLISLRPLLEGLVVPSKFYGVAAAGRPVIYIGDDNGEIPQILRENKCGWTIRPGDGVGLATRLRELTNNPDAVRQAGTRAREAFEQAYDKKVGLERWRELLQSVS